MPTFSITRTLQTANVKSYTAILDPVPSGFVTARITLDIPVADITDPTTDCEAGIEFAPTGTSAAAWASVARAVAGTGLTGNAGNSLTMPYVEIPASTLAFLVGKAVRGFLLTRTAGKQVGADLVVT